MVKSHSKIPVDIDAELSPKARKFFGNLIDGYGRRIAELSESNAKLAADRATLDFQLAKKGKLTPNNSSIPPSTQHPHGKDKPKSKQPKSATRKKRGGQPGHTKAPRPLVPTEDCDVVEVLRPHTCRNCAEELKGDDPEPLRHQVFGSNQMKQSNGSGLNAAWLTANAPPVVHFLFCKHNL